MNHNKKRNTAFLYECLVKELTKAIIREQKEEQEKIKEILKEFFKKGTSISKELELYNSLMESKELGKEYSKRLLEESKKDFASLDRKEIFNEQTRLINIINKQLGPSAFSNFVPNYKDLATLNLFFQNSDLPAKKRILLEDKMISFLGRKEEVITEMRHLDNLEFKTFVNNFNKAYNGSLLKEQKELLSNFIMSYSDNGLGLKSYLNEEIGRLKEAVEEEILKDSNRPISENLKKVKDKLNSYAETPLKQEIIEEIFYIQDLIVEVNRNDN